MAILLVRWTVQPPSPGSSILPWRSAKVLLQMVLQGSCPKTVVCMAGLVSPTPWSLQGHHKLQVGRGIGI